MTYPAPFTKQIRRKVRARRDSTEGLALLDVLLGMAIFALIAVIAAQAFGMFRHRAYLTQAVADAKQVSTGVLAKLAEPGVTTDDVPVGTFTPGRLEVLASMGINMTTGNWATIAPSSEVSGGFDVCVQNDHAYAWWRAEGAAIADHGYLPEGEGCHPGLPGGGDAPDGDYPWADGPLPELDCATDNWPMIVMVFDPDYDLVTFPRLSELNLSAGDTYYPDQIPGMTKETWEDPRAPWANWGASWRIWFTQAEAASWPVSDDGFFYLDEAGNDLMRTVEFGYVHDGTAWVCADPYGPPEQPMDDKYQCDTWSGDWARMPRFSAAEHNAIPQLADAGLADGEYFLPWLYFGSRAEFSQTVNSHRGTFWPVNGIDQRVLVDNQQNWDRLSGDHADGRLYLDQDNGVAYDDPGMNYPTWYPYGGSSARVAPVESPAGSGAWTCPDPGAG